MFSPQPRNRATAQPRNMRNSFSRPQVSRSHSANSFNRCHSLSAVAGTRATILQSHSTADGGQGVIARVPSAVATTGQQLRGLLESPHRLHQPSPKLQQPLHGFIQPLHSLLQPLPDATESLKEASQPSQDAQNEQFGINPSKRGAFESTTKHTKWIFFRVFGVFRGSSPFPNFHLPIPNS